MAFNTANFVIGPQYYGNDNNPLNGRFQALHFSGWSAGQDVTAGTPDTTIFTFPQPPAFEQIEILEIHVFYPAASGSVSTAAQLIPGKYAAGTNTPFVPIYLGYTAAGGTTALAGLYITSTTTIPINTVQKFNLGYAVPTTYLTAQCGQNGVMYPQIYPGDIPNMLLHTAGVGGTQSLLFGYVYRERVYPLAGPTMTSAGTNTSIT